MRQATLCLTLVLLAPGVAYAQYGEPQPSAPRVGGHFGLALSIASFDNTGNFVIGRDYVQIGVTPGIIVKLTQHWSVDFEFIGFSRIDINPPGVDNVSSSLPA
jgi:hypothetical protein